VIIEMVDTVELEVLALLDVLVEVLVAETVILQWISGIVFEDVH
jgi:hypothetical protein